MAKKTIIDDSYVRIDVSAAGLIPPAPGAGVHRRWLQDVIDEVYEKLDLRELGIEAVTIQDDLYHVCSHCGAPWDERSETYNGGCCEKDVASGVAERMGVET